MWQTARSAPAMTDLVSPSSGRKSSGPRPVRAASISAVSQRPSCSKMSPLIATVNVRGSNGSGGSVCSVLVGSLLLPGLVVVGPPVLADCGPVEAPGRAGSGSGDVDAVHPAARHTAPTQ